MQFQIRSNKMNGNLSIGHIKALLLGCDAKVIAFVRDPDGYAIELIERK